MYLLFMFSYPLSYNGRMPPGIGPAKMGIYRGAYAPGEKGKRLEAMPPAPWDTPCKASQSPLLRPRPGISPRHSHMAYSGSIAPGPGGPLRPRPYWLALPPPIHGPPPGGVYPAAGAYGSRRFGGRGTWGRVAIAGGVHESGAGRLCCQRAGVSCRGPPPWGRGLCRLPGPPGRA